MKRTLTIAAALILSLGLSFYACNEQSSDELGQAKEETRVAYESVKKDIHVSKKKFVNDVEGELDSLNREIRNLKRKIDGTSGEAKSELQKQWASLDNKREKLQKDLDELKARAGENWQELREDVDDQLDSLKDSFDDIKNELGIG